MNIPHEEGINIIAKYRAPMLSVATAIANAIRDVHSNPMKAQ